MRSNEFGDIHVRRGLCSSQIDLDKENIGGSYSDAGCTFESLDISESGKITIRLRWNRGKARDYVDAVRALITKCVRAISSIPKDKDVNWQDI